MNMDPVCGMKIEDGDNALKTYYEGKYYYFCTASCKMEFEKEPYRFLSKEKDHQHMNHCCSH